MIELLETPAVRRQVAPLSVDGYHRLRDWGLAPVKSELLNGVIVEKMTKSPLHTLLVHRLIESLSGSLPAGYMLRKEDPLTLSTSEPEPDLAIVEGDFEMFADRHPSTAKLVVEVAVSSEELDRAKADLYASAGIEQYWLVLSGSKSVIIFSRPRPTGYEEEDVMENGQSLTTWYGASISVDALFR